MAAGAEAEKKRRRSGDEDLAGSKSTKKLKAEKSTKSVGATSETPLQDNNSKRATRRVLDHVEIHRSSDDGAENGVKADSQARSERREAKRQRIAASKVRLLKDGLTGVAATNVNHGDTTATVAATETEVKGADVQRSIQAQAVSKADRKEARRKRREEKRKGTGKSSDQSQQGGGDPPQGSDPPEITEEDKARRQKRREEKKARRAAVKAEKRRASTDGTSAVPPKLSVGDDDKAVAPPLEVATTKADRRAEKKAKRSAARTAGDKKDVAKPDSVVKQESSHHSKDQKAVSTRRARMWKLSSPSAGRFLDYDPVFVQDADGEDYLLAAVEREVLVLSLESSLVVRSITVPDGQRVVCFAINEEIPYIVQVVYSNGSVHKHNWTTGEYVAGCDFTKDAAAIAFSKPPVDKSRSYPFYTCCDSKGSQIVVAGRFEYSTTNLLTDLQVLGTGEYVLARGTNALVVGAINKDPKAEKRYTWVEKSLTSPSTCMHAQLVQTAAKSSTGRPRFRLAVGSTDGKIHLHDDLSSLFSKQGSASLPSPQILHWHREAVSSLKFSEDGRYLISGGRETVLVLWQLETGKKQFLPHLTAAIERIVVNPAGDRYALQMGDTSIIVLNTSELKPVAAVAGLQLAPAPQRQPPAAALHHNRLLLSVPSTLAKSANDIATRPFLQTFDMRTDRHISRQALTRNNVTDFNLSPEKTPILPPDVHLLAISRDGNWLATVDEWTPPATDMEAYVLASEEECLARRECYLKFWHYEKDEGMWSLTMRIDSPHHRAGGLQGAGRVLAMAASPTGSSFASVGEDGYVRQWKVRARKRHGVVVLDEQGGEAREWVCNRSIRLETGDDRTDSPFEDFHVQQKISSAALAYSPDGSMLAVAQESGGDVYFIDTADGQVIVKHGLSATDITSVGFVGRHFIAASKTVVYVWDLITDELEYTKSISSSDQFARPILAFSEADGSFAVATNDRRKGKQRTKVKIFKPQNANEVYEQEFDIAIEALLTTSSSPGYTLLFEDATIRTLSPPGAASLPRAALEASSSTAAPFFAPTQPTPSLTFNKGVVRAAGNDMEAEEDDRPVVRPEQLADVFDAGGGVRDMFRAVVGMFGRKPRMHQPPEGVVV